MQMQYRATKLNTPGKDETLVRSRDQAFTIITDLDKKLSGTLSGQNRATFLAGRATLYEALGDKKMLEAAQEAFKYSKTANTAALVAVALHHFGRIKEANVYYKLAYRYPHESGFEVDMGWANALLSQNLWLKSWPIIRQLKKRMVYAAGLKDWNGEPVEKLSIISEGGYGDLIQNSRYLQKCTELAKQVTVYLPPFFFDTGFVDLAREQSWYPPIKPLIETPMNVKAAGFFDLPAIFKETPESVTPPPIWDVKTTNNLYKGKIGFCGKAKAFETPLCPDGIYRSLTLEQIIRIIRTSNINWVSLQHGENNDLKTWIDTASIIKNLDMVVTVDTAVMHLAASMGKPTWVILSGAVDWKFGIEGDTCPWYPNIRIFRNNDFGFENSVNNVIEALKNENLPRISNP